VKELEKCRVVSVEVGVGEAWIREKGEEVG